MFRKVTVFFFLAAWITGLSFFFVGFTGFDRSNPDLGLALARQASSSVWPAVLFISWLFCCWQSASLATDDVERHRAEKS